MNEKRVLNLATSTLHIHILADVVGHPKSSPTLDELAHTNPDIDEAVLQFHIDELVSADVLEVLDGEDQIYYRLSDAAREILDDNHILPEDAWTRQYERVEKPREIRDLEELPRP